MAILYALVARGSVILAEFSAIKKATNADAIARQIVEKTPGNNDSNVSYYQDPYYFHVKRTGGLTVLCLAPESDAQRRPFAFLDDIHKRFMRTYVCAANTAAAYAMNDEFSRILSQQMEHYSNDNGKTRLIGEMSQVRNVMIENIDRVLEGGDRQELLVDKTANLQGNTFHSKRQAHRSNSIAWWGKVNFWIAVIIILLVIVYAVLTFVCRGLTLPACLKEG